MRGLVTRQKNVYQKIKIKNKMRENGTFYLKIISHNTVLASSGYRDEISWLGWLKQWTFISQSASKVRFWWKLSSWFADGCLCALSLCDKERGREPESERQRQGGRKRDREGWRERGGERRREGGRRREERRGKREKRRGREEREEEIFFYKTTNPMRLGPHTYDLSYV